MDILPIIEIIGGVVIGIIGLVLSYSAAVFAMGYYKQGKSQAKLDEGNTEINTNTLLQQRISALETTVNTQTVDIERMSKEIIDLKNAVELKDKKITEFMEIFQGRNPQMEAFLTLMTKYVETNQPLLKTVETETVPTIRELQKYLQKQVF